MLRTACAAVLLAPVAQAEETTWEITGTLGTVVDTADFIPADLAVGTPYRVVVRFDNQIAPSPPTPVVCDAGGCRAPGSGETPTGFRYIITVPDMQFDLYAGTSCQPCSFSTQTGGTITVRDNYPVIRGVTNTPTDGISLGLDDIDDDVRIGLIFRTENLALDFVTGLPVPYLAPAIAASLETSVLQIEDLRPQGTTAEFQLAGNTSTVSNPTYGIGYILTARDCRVPARTDSFNGQLVDPRPLDCSNFGANRRNAWSEPSRLQGGGGLGLDMVSRLKTPSTGDIDDNWGDGSGAHAALGLPSVPFGSLFGEVTFGGPAAFPIVRGSTYPQPGARLNSNLVAYQRYNYSGGVTQLPLVMALSYKISDNSNDPSISPFAGDRPGGASLGATMSIVDGSAAVKLEAIRAAVSQDIRGVACGREANYGLPPGSILGTAIIDSGPGEQGSQSVVRAIDSCANPGQQIQLSANQDFIVVTGMQLPSRGRAAQPPSTASVAADGFLDSANTLRVTFDPAAPRELVQALADAIEPACVACELVAEELPVAIDLKPGSTDNCLNPGSNGVIPVALLGSASFAVADVRVDESLRLGSLGLRVRGKAPGCTVSAVNGDTYPDLLCHFQNETAAWQSGQGTVAVTGKLYTGAPFSGSDTVCLTQ